MKPLHGLFERMTELDALFAAAHATLSHGRRFRGEGARFKFDLEREVFRLHKALASGRYRHGRYRLFTVRDPKMRIIAAAPVRDRVVHHAVHDAIEPRLDRMFIHDSYACRAGKGTHRAIDRAHGFLRANRYGLHLDVKQQGKLRWSDAAVRRFKQRVREITDRHNGRSMRQRLDELRRYVVGWLNYFGHSHSYGQLMELDQWLRRRVRLCYWKDWKRPRTRRRHLLSLGIPKDEVHLATRSRKGYWRMAGNSIVQRALTNQWLRNQGVPDMRQQWIDLHYPAPPGAA